MNAIQWSTRALKQLRKIAPRDNAAIRTAVSTELRDLASARNVKTLANHRYQYRPRVGRYRVFFDHDSVVRIVSVEEVKKRDDRTY
jgi:mRNA-degrading endonuclease RelE of RelBE toxin-antitoxin system